MKFMKLGSKPDTIQSDGSSTRYVPSELAADITVHIGEVKFLLHKFPLLSKSNRLQKLILKASEENSEEISLDDFPGGGKAFEICAKFCYGMTVTLNAYNVVAARCAAEFLEMTEDVDRGNLIFKVEVFLSSGIFHSWKDSIIVLQTAKSLLPWSEDLKILSRCIDSIASKASMDPTKVTWSFTYNRKLAMRDKIVEHDSVKSNPKDWWVEDICELEIDLYKRVMAAIKSKGRMDGAVIGEALRTFAVRWLPDSVEALISDDHIQRNKSLIETIICLLPSDKGFGCSCSFLLKLLKAAVLVEADSSAREDLVKKISLKLDEASVSDLLIPAQSPQTTFYDIELVHCIVKRFVVHEKHRWDVDILEVTEKGTGDLMLGRASMMNVGRLVDSYLAEIADDPKLPLSSFIELSKLIPESARLTHDALYKAIDFYLKEHPSLTKSERKKICGLMDVKKLSMDASMHAAQNERLPLRVVVQVLFFEQIRAATTVQALSTPSHNLSNSSHNTEEEWDSKRSLENSKSIRRQMARLNNKEEGFQSCGRLTKRHGSKSSTSGGGGGGIQLLPSRSRRIFDMLWVMGGRKGNVESHRSSDTSGSSQSPASLVPGDTKSLGGSAWRRRSVS
ncbi:hypothetical protein Nepgr_001141 [Nepenthes gracilis]|uniref:Phototropic-responsive NPH3 family protein n=1 Tax=Nepenthes gracilis TaxID=150966 RepID=A0AAD3P818_NEPGR|nr:hypothetical protein Nepgr_001141 [Nepenthes gracilis]